MAKSVLTRGQVESGEYGPLGSRDAAERLCRDLYAALERRGGEPGNWSFVASFPQDEVDTELEFEARLWRQLQAMHDFDVLHHDWDPSVASDPADPRFSFSIGGQAWYVIGLHPAASRLARRFGHVALVFNPHRQFDELRARGRYADLRDVIRERDRRLQGSVNPMLSDHGETSEARQYSGRAVPPDWRCPFRRVTGSWRGSAS